MKKLLEVSILYAALLFATVYALCGQATAQPPPGPPMFGRGNCPGAIFGDGKNLYVTAGGKILEYKLEAMTLIHSVTLPAPAPPAGKPESMGHGPCPPMPPPPSAQDSLWAGNGKLYVLAGPALYVYQTPDLKLEKTVLLPR
ncbi:MAG: hypothetical protein ACP5SH_07520 [Syntrophobacteraceae bacterium]